MSGDPAEVCSHRALAGLKFEDCFCDPLRLWRVLLRLRGCLMGGKRMVHEGPRRGRRCASTTFRTEALTLDEALEIAQRQHKKKWRPCEMGHHVQRRITLPRVSILEHKMSWEE